LESVFGGNNRYHVGLDLEEYDFWPHYENGKLVALAANRVGPGAWHRIESSEQARDLVDLTFQMPHLTEQTGDDCVEALLKSPLLPQLQVFQIGDTGREWNSRLEWSDALCEGNDAEALVRLIERMPRVVELYLAEDLPEPNRVLAATFPPLLKVVLIRTVKSFDLSVLAQNDSLAKLKTLILHEERIEDPIRTGFSEKFGALMDSPGFDSVKKLRLDIPKLDDACCQLLSTSRMLKHLKRLWLRGEGLTDAGAAILAASPEVKELKELTFEGSNVTEDGTATLLNAGVQLRDYES